MTKPKTILRKKKLPSIADDSPVKYQIVEDYINSDLTIRQIADKYNTTELAVGNAVSRHYKALRNVKETRYLMRMSKAPLKPTPRSIASAKMYHSLFSDDGVNGEFLKRLSEPNEDVLLKWEIEFCYLWVYSVDEIEALEKSGLAIGLLKKEAGRKAERGGYDRSCRMRSLFLRRKPNIARTIKEIQKSNLIAEGIDKEFIQSELVREIQELREDKNLKARQLLSKNLEVLGKTIPGAFSEKIEISQIDPNQALQELIDMAKVSGEVLPRGSEVDETWELN